MQTAPSALRFFSRRVRQHVNPLSASHMQPMALPLSWDDVFDTPRSIHLDIG